MSTVLRPDIVIESPAGSPIAVVEIKNLPDFSRKEATEFRAVLLEHGYRTDPPYFLLLSQERGFLWKKSHPEDTTRFPLEFDMRSVVTRYFPELAPDDRLREPELALIVLRWLWDLADMQLNTRDEPEHTLAATGFLRDIVDTEITLEPSN